MIVYSGKGQSRMTVGLARTARQHKAQLIQESILDTHTVAQRVDKLND